MSRWRFDGLAVDRGEFRLGPVDLTIGEAETVAVIGRSGAGKTTLLRALAGLIPLASGSVTADGEDVSAWAPELRRAVYVPPGLGLFPHRSARENIRYPLRLRGEADLGPAEEAIERFGVAPFADRRPSTLSDGERQRVAAARAVLALPQLLLWDEPLTSLDADARHDLLGVLSDLVRRSRLPMLVVTHDAETAFTLADRFLLLDRGREVFTGDADRLVDRPPDPFAARFAGFENIWRPSEVHQVAKIFRNATGLATLAGTGGLCFPAPRVDATRGGGSRLSAEVRRVTPSSEGYRIDAETAGVPVRLSGARSPPEGRPPRRGDLVSFEIDETLARPLSGTWEESSG